MESENEPEAHSAPGSEHDSAQQDPSATVEHDHSTAGKSKSSPPTGTTYTCPMHPEIVRSEPGTCPKCGMRLVEKKVMQ